MSLFANISTSIYAELGPGRRVALAKLAADHLENTGRPLRLAIDISIWQFQIQAARGEPLQLTSSSPLSLYLLLTLKQAAQILRYAPSFTAWPVF